VAGPSFTLALSIEQVNATADAGPGLFAIQTPSSGAFLFFILLTFHRKAVQFKQGYGSQQNRRLAHFPAG
jgi:uncharacterized protein YfaP (DUF2135 family)